MTPGRTLVTAAAYESRPGRGRPDNAGAGERPFPPLLSCVWWFGGEAEPAVAGRFAMPRMKAAGPGTTVAGARATAADAARAASAFLRPGTQASRRAPSAVVCPGRLWAGQGQMG